MATPRYNLKHITLVDDVDEDEEGDDSNAKKKMNIIAQATKFVESLHVQADISSLGCFDKFIDKKKNSLRSVTIYNYGQLFSLSGAGKMTG